MKRISVNYGIVVLVLSFLTGSMRTLPRTDVYVQEA